MKTIYLTASTPGVEPNIEYAGTPDELAAKVKERLDNGIAHFVYRKKSDNSIREAFGTLNPSIVPSASIPESNIPGIVNYFDLAARNWRKYSEASLIALL